MPPVDEEAREVLDALLADSDMAEELKRSALARLEEFAPVLAVALSRGGVQARKVRHVVWSLYTCSHLVPLGDCCTGLDLSIARGLAAAVSARLLAGAEVEPALDAILRKSGEFDRRDRTEAALRERELPPEYPLPAETAKRLRTLAAVAEHPSEP